MQLAGPELIVLGIVVVAVVIVVFLANQSGSRTRASLPESKMISMTERADRRLARVATNLNGLPSHQVEWTSPDTLQLYWTRRPIWTLALAVVSFPIGLLAILHTNTLIGSLRIVELGPPGTVNIDGAFLTSCSRFREQDNPRLNCDGASERSSHRTLSTAPRSPVRTEHPALGCR